jgi:hypothetical protein
MIYAPVDCSAERVEFDGCIAALRKIQANGVKIGDHLAILSFSRTRAIDFVPICEGL